MPSLAESQGLVVKHWKRQAKAFVDRFFPRAGLIIRMLRAQRKAADKPVVHSQFGFLFSGNRQMMTGSFEPDEVQIFQALMPSVARVVDVGANIGYYVCIARALGRPCVAFEPLPTNLSMLYGNLARNGWLDTEVWPIGLADHVGMDMMYGSDTGASLVRGWGHQGNPLGTAIVLNTLDNVLSKRFSAERLLLLIDVEGFEYSVLCGAAGIFEYSSKPVVLIEIALSLHHPEANPLFLKTFEFLWDRGYRIMSADSSARLVSRQDVENWVHAGCCGWDVHNWLALPGDWS